MHYYKYGQLLDAEELKEIRDQFYYVDEDYRGRKRLFFDNAGGSLRLKKAAEEFDRINRIPDASEHSNEAALYLAEIEEKGREDIKKVIFNARNGTIYPSYTASQIMMEMVRIIGDHARGSNYVTTMLEHPSAFDAMKQNAAKHGCEFRIANVNKETGGVDAEEVLSKIDKDTAVLCCMAASNISGYIFEVEKIFKAAREINPDIYILCDAVQHAPHGALDPEGVGADVMTFAPYKFFGVRGMGLAYVSDRVSAFEHARLLGKAESDWEIGSPATPHFAALSAIVDYVVSLGAKTCADNAGKRDRFTAGMKRIADHERALLNLMLEGTEDVKGLRRMEGLKVRMDGKDLNTRDFILGMEFDHIDCTEAVRELDRRGVVSFERSSTSLYSKRMVEAFDSKGLVRISPLHVNTPEEILEFLKIVEAMISV